jgi:hypothetical protein
MGSVQKPPLVLPVRFTPLEEVSSMEIIDKAMERRGAAVV